VILFVLVAVRWRHYLIWPDLVFDEDIYIRAFRAASAGESPFGVQGYFYPAVLARVGGWLLAVLGEIPLRYLMRASVDLGLVVTVWLSLSLWRVAPIVRLATASVYVVVAPVVGGGLREGNLSFAVVGLVLTGLYVWPRRPVAAGLILGTSVAVKQLAPLAILSLLVHRPVPPSRKHWIAGGIAVAVAVPLLLAGSRNEMIAAARLQELTRVHSASLARELDLAGLHTNPVLIAIVVALLVIVVGRLRPMNPSELLCVATTAAVLSLPVVWSHTLLLTLPVQVLALVLAFDGSSSRAPQRMARYEKVLVVLLVASAQLAIGHEGALGHQAFLLQVAVLLVPILAPLFLTLFILHRTRTVDG